MTLAMHVVLLVEDDSGIQNVLRMLFEANGFRVVMEKTARGGQQAARVHRPDIIIVDLGLPDEDGVRVIQEVRTWSPIPIIVLSARTAEAQRLSAFEAGADDYVVKPFSAPELVARVRAALRRHVRGELPQGKLELNGVSVDLSLRTARRSNGLSVRLTPLEHRMLETLIRNADRVVTHKTLMREVWGPHREDSRSLRVYIGSLRRKLEEDPSRPQNIVTEPGVGYRLVVDPKSVPQLPEN
jgi:two-component system, OmpR family, KDP operon response regulator KdpE